MTKINCNEVCEVTLTEEGMRIARTSGWEFLKIEGDVLTIQLWELMQLFGHRMFNGCKIPFVLNEIRFGEDVGK